VKFKSGRAGVGKTIGIVNEISAPLPYEHLVPSALNMPISVAGGTQLAALSTIGFQQLFGPAIQAQSSEPTDPREPPQLAQTISPKTTTELLRTSRMIGFSWRDDMDETQRPRLGGGPHPDFYFQYVTSAFTPPFVVSSPAVVRKPHGPPCPHRLATLVILALEEIESPTAAVLSPRCSAGSGISRSATPRSPSRADVGSDVGFWRCSSFRRGRP
jgi:hypothetical protein